MTRGQGSQALLVAVGGLIASGKTSVARGLAAALGGIHIEADRVRDEILGIGPGPAAHQAAWRENLAPGATDKIYAELLERARKALASGQLPILDGCFARREQRVSARGVASAQAARFVFVECQTAPERLRERLCERSAASGVAPESWLELLERLTGRWEPVNELSASEHVRVDSSKPIAAAVEEVLEALRPVVEIADRLGDDLGVDSMLSQEFGEVAG